MRTQLELDNDVAAELAGPGDAIMKTLEQHLDCDVFLRGNVLTLDGADDDVAMGRTVVRELTDLVAAATRSRPARSRRSRARSTATRARAASSRTWSGATAA